MDEALKKIKPVNILNKINACRIYFKVIYLSNIYTISGRALTKGVLTCCDKKLLPSMLQWPNQGEETSDVFHLSKFLLRQRIDES